MAKLEITEEMLDAIEAVKGRREANYWDPECRKTLNKGCYGATIKRHIMKNNRDCGATGKFCRDSSFNCCSYSI